MYWEPCRVGTAASARFVPSSARDRHVLACGRETRSGNVRGECSRSHDGQKVGWLWIRNGWVLQVGVCVKLRGLRNVFWSQSAQRRLRTGRAHVLTWRTPRTARFVFDAQGDVMAARVVGVRQEGVKPCRMVPSMRDEVHGSCMTSRARSKVHGRALPCRSARCELPRWNCAKFKKKRINLEKESKPRFRVNRIPWAGVKDPLSGAQDTSS